MRKLGIYLAVAIGAGPLQAVATDAPHDASSPQGVIRCEKCHMGHSAPGAGLTKEAGIFTLCNSCHSLNPTQGPIGYGFGWNPTDQATPGVGGRSHRWDAIASNFGATPPDPNSADPVEAAMGQYLDSGKLKCTTCHDVHQADVNRGSLKTSVPQNTDILGTGSGIMQLTKVPANAAAAGYIIRLSAPNAFKISHDNTISFFGYNATLTPKWNAETVAGYSNGKTFTPGIGVPLDDEATEVTFSGTLTTGEEFPVFYVSYPFLRSDNTDSKMCVTCHRNRYMNHVDVEGGVANGLSGGRLASIELGTTVFSHPVGPQEGSAVAVTLNANGRGYDRTPAEMLDADGSAQSSGTDTNTSNNLRLGTGGIVHCMTCHHPHNADSNSITPDPSR